MISIPPASSRASGRSLGSNSSEATPWVFAVDPIKNRLTAVMVFCLLVASAVVARAVIVQVVGDARLETMAQRQFHSKVLIRPKRGMILDRNGDPLAANAEIRSLAANPSKIEQPKAMAKLLEKGTGIPAKKILKKLTGPSTEFVWIKRHLSEEDLHQLRKTGILDGRDEFITGLMGVKESQRIYPHQELAAQVLGDVNIDSEGVEGIELVFDEKMRGKVLTVSSIRDAKGRPTFLDAQTARNAQAHRDGETVQLTLDAALQFSVEEELKKATTQLRAAAGSVIVMDAENGEILAMANTPTFNPNDPSGPLDRRRNRAVTDGYEPGSTFKALLAAGGLLAGWKGNEQVWGENGEGFTLQGRKISEAEAHEKFGFLNLSQMIEFSSNVAAAKFALKLGTDKLYSTVKLFGLGSRTGIGFPGEISGIIPAKKAWQPLTLANIGFGHGLLVSPIQMTRAYAAFLNGGYLVQPKLVRDVQLPAALPPQRILPEKTAEKVLQMLEGPLRVGNSGAKAFLPGYRIAGKTGTAQKVDPETRAYSRSNYVATFIGMPLDVSRKIVIFTMIDEPKGIYYASETAAPLFREVLNAVATRLSLPVRRDTQNPVIAQAKKLQNAESNQNAIRAIRQSVAAQSEGTPEAQGMASALGSVHTSGELSSAAARVVPAGESMVQGENSKTQLGHSSADRPALLKSQWISTNLEGKAVYRMPDLKGYTPREVMRYLNGHPFQLRIEGKGWVQVQKPAPGEALVEGAKIHLKLESHLSDDRSAALED